MRCTVFFLLCFISVLLLAAVAYAASPDLDALCKEKYGDEQSSGKQKIGDACRVECRGTKSPLALHLFLEDGTTCGEGKSCLRRDCVNDSDVEACKTALKDDALNHIHIRDCRVECHAEDRSKDTVVARGDDGSCGMFGLGKCKAGKCVGKNN